MENTNMKPPEEVKQPVREEVITEDDVREASQRLKKYQDGKKFIDAKATANQEWWRGRHWSQISDKNTSLLDDKKPASAWLFNSIINKVADMMDNFPKPNILPREKDDEVDAQQLSQIVPVILEQNHYEDLYRTKAYDYVGDGTAISCVLWDNTKNNGMGDITINLVDIHNIFWKPGIDNIQDSPEVFLISPIDNEELIKMYPQMEGKTGKDITKTEYVHDDSTGDDSNLSYIVDWYYKVLVQEEVEMGVNGDTVPRTKTILHYVKYCNGEVLYSSENEGMDKGFYWHGLYPFVFMKAFPIKDSPCGFGYIDVMKDPQMYIDMLDQLILKSAMMCANPRWWVRDDSSFDADVFADWSKPFIPYGGADLEDTMKQVEVPPMPAFVVNQLIQKIDELKETSGNRDFSQGSAAQGVTAATAIAALQEAGSKLSRLSNKGAYAAFRDECYLIVELTKQFFTEPRSFRIDDGEGGYTFIEYSSLPITDEEALALGITPVDNEKERRRPVYDIQVVAEKQSPFSRASQNETAKEMFNMGMFNPNMAEPALVCLDMMDFEQRDDIKQQVQNNSLMLQQMNQMASVLQQIEAVIPGTMAMAGLAPQEGMAAPTMPSGEAMPSSGKSIEEKARDKTEATSVAKARTRAANQGAV